MEPQQIRSRLPRAPYAVCLGYTQPHQKHGVTSYKSQEILCLFMATNPVINSCSGESLHLITELNLTDSSSYPLDLIQPVPDASQEAAVTSRDTRANQGSLRDENWELG